jgi:hypothetical protein
MFKPRYIRLPPLEGIHPLPTESAWCPPGKLPDGAPVSSLVGQVSTRLYNSLRSMDYATVGELKSLTDEELSAIPGLGRGLLKEFRAIWPAKSTDEPVAAAASDGEPRLQRA